MESQSKLNYWVFRRNSNRKHFHAHLCKFRSSDKQPNCRILLLELWSGLKITRNFYFEKSWRAIKGSVSRGGRWESLAETKWNEVRTLSFHLKDKRAVRDRWVLLQEKYKAKMHQEETASGISLDGIISDSLFTAM